MDLSRSAIEKFINARDIFFKAFREIPDSDHKMEVLNNMMKSFDDERKRLLLSILKRRPAVVRARNRLNANNINPHP
jgi:hypothetical protein